jgi:hypothetical protein
MKFLEFNIEAGQVVYVPPFWHYSLKMVGEDDHVCHVFDYSSPMNIMSNVFNIGHHLFEKYGPSKMGLKEGEVKIETI